MNEQRYPKSPKERKFFGAVSFDEYTKPSNTDSSTTLSTSPSSFLSKCRSPKFIRAKSFVIPSPKFSRKFFQNTDTTSNNDNSDNTITSNTSFIRKNRFTKSLKQLVRQKSQQLLSQTQPNNEQNNQPKSLEINSNFSTTSSSSSVSNSLISQSDIIDENCEFIVKIHEKKIGEENTRQPFDHWGKLDNYNRSSSATELISRRGVFSRRHYGSVDQLPQTDLEGLDPNCRRFRLENGESLAEIDEVFGSPSTPILENPEHQTRWYFKYFLGKLHQNYVGIDTEKNPYFLSIVSQDSGNKCIPLYRAILFRKQGAQKIALPYTQQQKLTVKQLLTHFSSMDTSKAPKELFSADIQKDLLLLEEQEGSVNFKFGVVYMKCGQKCDDEMLSNENGSEDFNEFLGVLGEKIRLKGWERFRGGLDVKGDMTGKYSIYTLYEGHEIMFHVSTLLPFSRDNRQQVERKRHIGNDIINIVFIDGETDGCDFVPNCIKSQFTHMIMYTDVFAIVTKQDNIYKLAIYCDETVPPFGPTLPKPPHFKDPIALREFLLVKLINGEKATFQTPTFSRKRERTLEMLIKDLYEECVHDTKMNMLNRRAFSEVLYDAPRTSRLKEDARQVEFVRIGQALKLEAIVRGDAPTSLASTGTGSVFKRPPWEPQCFYAAFYHRGVIVGDSYGHDSIFLCTDEGTFLIREDQTSQLIFDKTLCVRQISVIEDHGIMLIRGGSPTHKEGHRIHVFKLSEFRDDRLKVRSRADVRDRRIEKTRGCHLYTISKGGDGHLRLAVAVGKKMITFQWKYTAAWTSWCANNETETVEGFLFLREINLHDTPTIMTILEGPANKNTGLLICVGFKHNFEIVCEQTGQCTRLHDTESSKRSQTQLVTALDLCDGQETELLLCYNHTCHFQKIQDEPSKSTEFDFHWNTSPTSIVCAFPYIIAFTSDSIEIRLLVNGNLVHTVTMADLQLITSKRDIYFATTAPEFIPKDFRIKGQENEYNTDSSPVLPNTGIGIIGNESSCSATESNGKLPKISSNAFGHFSNERILEIKHKIDKIGTQTSAIGEETDDNDDKHSEDDDYDADLHINTVDNLYKLLPIPSSSSDGDGDQSPSYIHRARSLVKPKQSPGGGPDELRRQISKSSSCGDATSCCATTLDNHQSYGVGSGKLLDEPDVPPNSPKRDSTASYGSDITISPIKFHTKSYQHHRTIQHLLHNTNHHHYHGNFEPSSASSSSSQPATEKIKPLRIFRIPLANLTGAHSHYHTHSSTTTASTTLGGSSSLLTSSGQSVKVSKIQSHKIAEDQAEVDATVLSMASASIDVNYEPSGSRDDLNNSHNNSNNNNNGSCSGSNVSSTGSNHCTTDIEVLSSL